MLRLSGRKCKNASIMRIELKDIGWELELSPGIEGKWLNSKE